MYKIVQKCTRESTRTLKDWYAFLFQNDDKFNVSILPRPNISNNNSNLKTFVCERAKEKQLKASPFRHEFLLESKETKGKVKTVMASKFLLIFTAGLRRTVTLCEFFGLSTKLTKETEKC